MSAGKKKHEFWASIDHRCEPSRAAGVSDVRPTLKNGFICHESSGSWLYLTDSYVMVRLPIDLSTADPKEQSSLKKKRALLPEVALPPVVLRALDGSTAGRFRIVDGLVEIDGEEALYRVADPEAKPPDFAAIIEPALDAPDAALQAVAFNSHFLRRAARAMGVHTLKNEGVRLRFVGPLRPIRVEPVMDTGARALLMPIRGPRGSEG